MKVSVLQQKIVTEYDHEIRPLQTTDKVRLMAKIRNRYN